MKTATQNLMLSLTTAAGGALVAMSTMVFGTVVLGTGAGSAALAIAGGAGAVLGLALAVATARPLRAGS